MLPVGATGKTGGEWTMSKLSPTTSARINISYNSFKSELKLQFANYLRLKKANAGSESLKGFYSTMDGVFTKLYFKESAGIEAELFGAVEGTVVNFANFNFPAKEGFTDIIIHFHDGKYWIRQSGTATDIEMSIDNLAKVINEAPAGNTVLLLSCNSEQAALELAKYTNRPFYASDGWVDVNTAGDVASENAFYKFTEGKKTEGSLEHVTVVEGDVVRLGKDRFDLYNLIDQNDNQQGSLIDKQYTDLGKTIIQTTVKPNLGGREEGLFVNVYNPRDNELGLDIAFNGDGAQSVEIQGKQITMTAFNLIRHMKKMRIPDGSLKQIVHLSVVNKQMVIKFNLMLKKLGISDLSKLPKDVIFDSVFLRMDESLLPELGYKIESAESV